MREKNKMKIVFSLLIAVFFMLPASVIGSNITTEKTNASTTKIGTTIGGLTLSNPETEKTIPESSLVPLAVAFPVGITAISLDGINHLTGDIVATGTYDLDVTACRLDQLDPMPATVKKFIEIFKKVVIPGTPDTVKDIYCEDFEDPCEIAENWVTLDMPVWGYNGALDTWTWSAKRYASPSHSMHSTSFDEYLPNQWDILELGFGGTGLDVSAYDNINITWKQFVEGDIQGTTIQDYGYFEYSWDDATWTTAGVKYYDSDGAWQTISLNIPVTGTNLFFRWVWKSDPIFCYEGWYIDDVCLKGIIGGVPGTTTWVFVMDSHSYPQIIEEPCETYIFNETWTVTEEGEYRICAWLQAIDEDHFSVTEYYNPYCIYITVGNHLDFEIDCESLVISPTSPAWEGDDISASVDVCNVGTLDAEDVQVEMKVQRGTLATIYEDGFERANDVEDWTLVSPFPDGTKWFRSLNIPNRSNYHITTYMAASGTSSLANFIETSTPYYYSIIAGSTSEWIGSPYVLNSDMRNSDVKLTFKANWKIAPLANVRWSIGIMDNSTGWGTYYVDGNIYSYGGSNANWNSNGWVEIKDVPISSLVASLYGMPYMEPGSTDLSFAFRLWKYNVQNYNTAGDPWSGVVIDDVKLTNLVAAPEIIYSQTQEIPFLNITDCATVDFTWPDAGVGQYVITTSVITPDENPDNNVCQAPYNIINYEVCPTDETVECVDYTGQGQGHWVEEACCGGYFWIGDPVTTQYGNNWSDCLYLRNATGGLTFDFSAEAGICIEFDTWFQLAANDFGYFQVSMDDGITWNNAATYFGYSTDMGWGADSFGFFHEVQCDGVSSTMQFRFLFESNASGVERGWIVDNIEINDGGATIFFGPDPCLNFNHFYRNEKQYGCWWMAPDQFGFEIAFSYGCYDPNYFMHPWVGYYPDNLDNALIWTFDTPDVFYGYLSDGITGYNIYNIGSGDKGYMDVATDEGWETLAQYGPNPTTLYGDAGPWGVTPYLDGTMQIRWRFTSNAANAGFYFGFGFEDICFYGMKDLNAPVTTLQMSGTFDETFHYYTSSVKMKLTATDDITGVAHTYYKLDGVTSEYTGLVTINTDGDHTFCYWSVDNEGNVETEKCVPPFRIDLTGPTVTITGPSTGALYLFGSQILPLKSGKTIFLFGGIPVTASVTVDEAPIQVVQFFLDDVLLAEDSTAPYGATLSAKHSGAAVIKVVAKDVLGHEGSATLNIDNYVKII